MGHQIKSNYWDFVKPEYLRKKDLQPAVSDDAAQDEADVAAAQYCNPRYFEELRKQRER